MSVAPGWKGHGSIGNFAYAVSQMVPLAFKEHYWAALTVWQQPLLWPVGGV